MGYFISFVAMRSLLVWCCLSFGMSSNHKLLKPRPSSGSAELGVGLATNSPAEVGSFSWRELSRSGTSLVEKAWRRLGEEI
jgi:hypothetical protein